ncbi:TPA: VOC family protein [Legionella pneumophila]
MFSDPNLVLFYVKNPAKSEEFYKNLLDTQPAESSPTFSMFVLKTGLRLGLWAKEEIEPQAYQTGGGMELSFQVNSNEMVDEIHKQWSDKEISIIQPPTQMDFGYTFVGVDPDEHRLRIFCLKRT